MKSLIFTGLALLASASALADPCMTSSRGIRYFDGRLNTNVSSAAVVESCRANPVTLNDECVRNLRCGFDVANPYPSGVVSCSTESRELKFEARSGVVNSAVSSALEQCKGSRYTVNDECARNIRCIDAAVLPPSSGRAVCTTLSRGLEFRAEAGKVGSASSQAAEQCKSSRYTNNDECVRNLRCDSNYYGPPLSQNVGCTTSSKGLSFRQAGLGMLSVSTSTVEECKANRYTVNEECIGNISCRYLNAHTPPPVVTSQPPVVVPPPPPIGGRGWECSRLTQGGHRRYHGSGPTQADASREAMQSCLRVEQPIVCHRQSEERCRPL